MKNLQNEILKLTKEFAENSAEAQRIFVQTMKEKDEQMQEMMRMTLENFRSIMKKTNETNENQFNRLMDLMEKQDERINDLLMRMDKRLEQLESNARDGVNDGDDDENISLDDIDDMSYSGADLYRWVQQRKEQVANQYSLRLVSHNEGKSSQIFVPFLKSIAQNPLIN